MVNFSLCSYPPDTIRDGKHRYKIDPSYQVVLKCQEVLGCDALSDIDKIDICVSLILRSRIRHYTLSAKKKTELFRIYLDTFVGRGEKTEHAEKVMDLKQDAEAIYASFWQCYGIDLLGRHKNLHWWTFLALLGGLSDDTELMRIISIRTRPMPKPTKYNADERQALLKLKAKYRLKLSEEERKKQYQEGLKKMAVMLQSWAEKK